MPHGKLKRHLTTNHKNLSGKPREFFARKLSETNKQSVLFSIFAHTSQGTACVFQSCVQNREM